MAAYRFGNALKAVDAKALRDVLAGVNRNFLQPGDPVDGSTAPGTRVREVVKAAVLPPQQDASRLALNTAALSKPPAPKVGAGPSPQKVVPKVDESGESPALRVCRVLVEELGCSVLAADAKGMTALHAAAARGGPAMLRLFIDAFDREVAPAAATTADAGDRDGANAAPQRRLADVLDLKRTSLLHVAVRHDRPACVALLLERGLAPMATDEALRTAFHFASSRAVLQLLLEAVGVVVSDVDSGDDAPDTVTSGDVDAASERVAAALAATTDAVRGAVSDGRRGLAVRVPTTAAAALPPLGTVFSRERDDFGQTPLHSVCKGGDVVALELLILAVQAQAAALGNPSAAVTGGSGRGAGASSSAGSPRPLIQVDCLDRNEETPLHYAAKFGHASLFVRLVRAGARIEHENKHGETPLSHAMRAADCVSAGTLVAAGAKVDRKLDRLLQVNAQHAAAASEREAKLRHVQNKLTAKEQQKSSLKETAPTSDRRTASTHADAAAADAAQKATSGSKPTVRPSSVDEADFNADRGSYVDSLLCKAAMEGLHDTCAALVSKAGASVHCQRSRGWTPLHFAAWKGQAAVCETLLRLGALPNKTDLDGRYAADLVPPGRDDALAAVGLKKRVAPAKAQATAAV